MRIILEEHPHLLDPSELLRPEPEFADKALSKFRDYSVDENDPIKERVRRTYRLMHKNQTVDFVLSEFHILIKEKKIARSRKTISCLLRSRD